MDIPSRTRTTVRDVGFTAPASWTRAILFGLAAGLGMEALELFVTQPALIHFLHQPPDLSELAGLRGSVSMLLLALALTWTLAAFGEELAHRGYILNRLADVLPNNRLRWPIAVAVGSVLFGLAHFNQGITGIVENTIDGALLATLYLASGRNLWVPIVAHGITDTADSLLLFLGKYPIM
jgi:membrane protease YdiL (CAAX protease family)